MGCGASSAAVPDGTPSHASRPHEVAKPSSPEDEEAAAAARRRQEEEAAARRQEEEAAARRRQEAAAAARRRQEEEAAARRRQEEEEEAARRRQEERDKLITSLNASLPPKGVPLEDLPDVIQDLHVGMPERLAKAPMRLVHISKFLSWANHVKVYEDVEPSECIDLPYADVTDEQWATVLVLSWRWGSPKPKEKDPAFSPMLGPQLHMLREMLEQAAADGFEYLWLDWCCVPQYSAPSMVEVLRSKVFYTRARAMVVLPTFSKVEGIVKVLLSRVLRMLERSKAGPSSVGAAGAASAADGGAMTPKEAVTVVLKSMVETGVVAEREYFSRIWTLVERMARFGRGERLRNWISLPAWLGMLADAMLKSTDDPAASKIYKKILGPEASALLESILKPLVVAMRTSSVVGTAEGIEELVAELFVLGAAIWNSPAKLEETPSKAWLLSYLEEFSTGMYNCFSDADRIWALYSYFCWKQLDQDSEVALETAVRDLVQVAGGTDKHLAAVAVRLGLTRLQQEAEGRLQEADAARKREEEAAVRRRQEEEAAARRRQEEEAERRQLEEEAAAPEQAAAGRQVLAAVRAGDVAAVKRLLAAKIRPNLGVRGTNGTTPLFIAAQNGHVEVAKALLGAGADKDKALQDGFTPLFVAAQNGHVEVAKALLGAGADRDKAKQTGATPLYIAAECGHVEVAKALLGAGADKDKARQDGWTPLLIAAHKGHVEVARALLGAGADKDKASQDGDTPLHVAARKGHADVVRALLAAGANRSARNKAGKTPYECATQTDVQQLLRA